MIQPVAATAVEMEETMVVVLEEATLLLPVLGSALLQELIILLSFSGQEKQEMLAVTAQELNLLMKVVEIY